MTAFITLLFELISSSNEHYSNECMYVQYIISRGAILWRSVTTEGDTFCALKYLLEPTIAKNGFVQFKTYFMCLLPRL
jgi:hypothetical protein